MEFCAGSENYLTITFTNVWRTLLDGDGNVIPWCAWELGKSIAQNGPLHRLPFVRETFAHENGRCSQMEIVGRKS